ncbi:MAG: sigma-54-dependent Fis family transcriptional regulator, partial [Elusimicrobia bacterium]|nr:sigma-54-dependent Fis family transcriptional regulator [Elusimicrobiota bacterium]
MSEYPRLLIIDDDETFANDLVESLSELEYKVLTARDRLAGARILAQKKVPVVLLGMNQSKEATLEDLRWIKEHFPLVEVIVFAQRGQFRTAFSAMSLNAYDFLVKSPNIAEFVPIIDQAYRKAHDHYRRKTSRGQAWSKIKPEFSEMLGVSPQIQMVLDLITKVAPTNSSVILLGETGVGKEMAARLIHQNSRRRDTGFVAINCGAIPENLLESELFGHAKGAFTDAVSLKEGLIEESNRGTLFLDEVSELGLALQVKLLRMVETGVFRRLGENKERHADLRIVCAANCDLIEAVKSGRFRADLYYRLAVVTISIPPLRSRRDDIPLLAEHFLRQCEPPQKGAQKGLSSGAIQMLVEYDWPGSVREVKNVMEKLVVLSEGKIVTARDVANAIPGLEAPVPEGHNAAGAADSLVSLEEAEKRHIQRVLD